MPLYPWATQMPVREAGCIGPVGNVPRRYIVHATGGPRSRQRSAADNVAAWENAVRHDRHFHVSAHFTIEKDGAVVQHLDTDNLAYGTGKYNENAVHVEHTCDGKLPLTVDQFFATTALFLWLHKLTKGELPLELSGSDVAQPGMTCHRYIQEQFHKASPKAHIEWRVCPGLEVMRQMPGIIEAARLWAPAWNP